jgi:hypothetical protein
MAGRSVASGMRESPGRSGFLVNGASLGDSARATRWRARPRRDGPQESTKGAVVAGARRGTTGCLESVVGVIAPEGLIPAPTAAVPRVDSAKRGQPPT